MLLTRSTSSGRRLQDAMVLGFASRRKAEPGQVGRAFTGELKPIAVWGDSELVEETQRASWNIYENFKFLYKSNIQTTAFSRRNTETPEASLMNFKFLCRSNIQTAAPPASWSLQPVEELKVYLKDCRFFTRNPTSLLKYLLINFKFLDKKHLEHPLYVGPAEEIKVHQRLQLLQEKQEPLWWTLSSFVGHVFRV